VKTLEEITYEAGREALSDQKSTVFEIRQRTGTLLAADALVSSFLGGTAIDAHGFRMWEWAALAVLVASLMVAAAVLGSWKLGFALDARDLYEALRRRADAEAGVETMQGLAAAGFVYQRLQLANARKVRWMSWLSDVLGTLMIVQTVLWLAALGLD